MNQNGPTSLKKRKAQILLKQRPCRQKHKNIMLLHLQIPLPKGMFFPLCASSSMMVPFYKNHGSKTFTGSIFNQPFLSKLQIQKGRAEATGKRNCTQDLSVSKRSEQSSSEQIVFCFHTDSY
jgi:hypothetical protein